MDETPEYAKDEKGRFVTGNIGGGRHKGARNKLGELFVNALHDDFNEHGVDVIAKVRAEDPTQYVKVVASLLPKELNVKVSELDELSDEQIARQLATVARQLTAAGFDLGAGAGAETVAQQTGDIPTLQ